MKKALKILTFLIFSTVKSQTQIHIFFKDECNETIFKEYSYELTNNDIIYKAEKSNILSVPNGIYLLTASKTNGEYQSTVYKTIEIKDNIPIYDTITFPKILLRTETALHSKYAKYFVCDVLCEGEQIDFYPNGNIKLKGKFKDGEILELLEFYENGKLWCKTVYRKTKKTTYFYEDDGKLYKKIVSKKKKDNWFTKEYIN